MHDNRQHAVVPRRQFLRLAAGAMVTGAVACNPWLDAAEPSTAPAGSSLSAGDRDVTFFIASDTHYGLDQAETNEALNKSAIDVLNTLAGRPFPKHEFGLIAEPRAV